MATTTDLTALTQALERAERACSDDNTDAALDYVRDALRHVAALAAIPRPALVAPATEGERFTYTLRCDVCGFTRPAEGDAHVCAPPAAAPPQGTVTINGLDYQQMTDIVIDGQGLTRDHLPVPPPPVEDMPDDTCGVCGIERAVAYHQTVPGEQDAGCCYDSFGHRWQRRKET